jgi:hypothetical protein
LWSKNEVSTQVFFRVISPLSRLISEKRKKLEIAHVLLGMQKPSMTNKIVTTARNLHLCGIGAVAALLLSSLGLYAVDDAAPTGKPVNQTKPVKVYLLSGQSNMVGMGIIGGDKTGTLETLVKKEKKFQHLVDADGKWNVRNDVFFVDLTNKRITKWMTVGVMGRTLGPEVQFGHLLGDHHDEMVLVIKIAQGNRSIGHDLTPPSSRIGASKEGKFYKGWQYDVFITDANKILNNLKDYFPAYKGQGYEVAGFCWWQGHKDGGMSQRYYERHLVNLINDLRTEFKAPKAPFAIATVGFGGKSMDKKYRAILKAQMAVADPKKYPKFAGNVASTDIRDLWRNSGPNNQGHHYNGNAETYMLVGDALGRSMLTMINNNQ